jgi:nucleoside-diphosphate-sugar epimerase
MKTVLVTGATGRVGSRFVPRLLQRENTVRILVRQAEQAEPFRKLGAEVIVGDLSARGRAWTVLAVEVEHDQIHAIRIIANPDKLTRV